MNEVKYSIVTATYNCQHTLKNTIQSVLDQNLSNFEYIIIDGQSKDNTVGVIQSFEAEFAERSIHYQWVSEKDNGIYSAFNKGLSFAKGEWVGFVGGDDVLNTNYLSSLDQYLVGKKLDFVSFKANITSSGKVVKQIGEAWNWGLFKREMKVVHVGSLLHSSYFEKYGPFDETYEIAGDYDLLLRAKGQLKAGFLNEVLVSMGGEGVSSSMVKKSLTEAKKAKLKNKARVHLMAEIDYIWINIKIKLKGILGKA